MDFSSPHRVYIMGAYILAGVILVLLTVWTVRTDRRARGELAKWKSDEAEV